MPDRERNPQVTYKVDVTIDMPEDARRAHRLPGTTGPRRSCATCWGRTSRTTPAAAELRRHHPRPFTVKACGRRQLDEAVQTKVQQMHTDEHDQRSAAADKKSAAIDPFDKKIDLNCEVQRLGAITPRGRARCPRRRPLGRSSCSAHRSRLATSDPERGGQACRRTCHPVCTWRKSSRARAPSKGWVRRWPRSSASPRRARSTSRRWSARGRRSPTLFGGFVPGSYLARSVYGYFMNGGGNCYVVRIGQNGSRAEQGRQGAAGRAARPARSVEVHRDRGRHAGR